MMVGRVRRVINAQWLRRPCGIRAPLWGLALALAALALNFVPLFNLLGYDFSFAIGLLAAFAAVDVGHGAVAMARQDSAEGPPPTTGLIVRSTATALALLVMPLLLSSLNALRVRNCGFATGLAFYGLLPVSTALFAAPAGVVAGLLFPRRGRALALLLPVVSISWAALRIYSGPAVYAYDPFGGYFPGPIYDEALLPPPRLWRYRLANLLWISAAVVLVNAFVERLGPEAPSVPWSGGFLGGRLRALRLDRLLGIVLVCGAAVFVFVQRGTLGFHRSHANLREELSRTHSTAHFQVHRSPSDGMKPEEVKLFLRELEFRYDQLEHILGVEPQLPVRVFLFADAEQKKDLVGAGATLFTKPWHQEIYLQVESFPPENLRHELAHIFASAFGDPIFGISLRWLPFPRLASGLVEGVAEASDYDNPDGPSTFHQDARSIIDDGRAPGLRAIVGAGFSTVAGARAYTLAASFCHYLLTHFGAEKLRRVYRWGGDIEGVYGKSLDQLEAAWVTFLRQQPVDAQQRATAQERYRRPAIFQKVCARELAARAAEASRIRSDEPERAVDLMQKVCNDDPSEPTYALSLAYAQAAANRWTQARQTLTELSRDPDLTVPLRRRLASFRSALELATGDVAAARAAEMQALEFATEEADRRSSLARLRALSDPGAQATIGRVLFGDRPTEALDAGLVVFLLSEFDREHPREALGDYLVGRQLVSRDPKLALDHLGRACPDDPNDLLPIPLEPVFLRECLRLRGEAGYRSGAYANATTAWQRARGLAVTEADRLRAADALARLEWVKTTPTVQSD